MKKLLLILTLAVLGINLCEAQESDNARKMFQFGLKLVLIIQIFMILMAKILMLKESLA
jgi:hypothetical protein